MCELLFSLVLLSFWGGSTPESEEEREEVFSTLAFLGKKNEGEEKKKRKSLARARKPRLECH
jgi:hypothetical protein